VGKCKEAMEVFARTVGFYRPVQFWNDAKVEEFNDRSMYKVNNKAKDYDCLYCKDLGLIEVCSVSAAEDECFTEHVPCEHCNPASYE